VTRLNWERVRRENLVMRHGGEPMDDIAPIDRLLEERRRADHEWVRASDGSAVVGCLCTASRSRSRTPSSHLGASARCVGRGPRRVTCEFTSCFGTSSDVDDCDDRPMLHRSGRPTPDAITVTQVCARTLRH